MFRKVLVANRGEIACRILRTLRKMGIASVAIHSDVDAFARHVREADEAVCVGGPRPADSYLRADRILEVALQTGAEAIHPGYGFLSERSEFAADCERAGIRFVGPTSEQMREFGLKHRAREIAASHGVPLLPGTPLLADAREALLYAEAIGYPVMLKSTAGGGGIGLRVCRAAPELALAFESVERLGRENFGQSGAFLEKFVERARHVEVQIFGDGRGEIVVLGERDCSVQRRNQKVIEETPAPGLLPATRDRLFDAAVRMGRAVKYQSAGTVEFVLDAASQAFFFLEVNTRLQVEHGVTEAVTGVDLVEWMILEASSSLRLEPVQARGAAIEVRVYAEDPAKEYQPSSGTITEIVFGGEARVDGWVEPGTEITPYYDPLIAKVIARGDTRDEAIRALERSLEATRIGGLETNLAYLRQIVSSAAFRSGDVSTQLLASFEYCSTSVEVIEGGTQTTVQDLPGRVGAWAVGVPPSGPMDDLAFAVANRIVGNGDGAAGLEMTLSGPTLRFRSETVIALAGARMKATVDGTPVPFLQPVRMTAGSELRLGSIAGPGFRTYLAVRGGIDVPVYLGSRIDVHARSIRRARGSRAARRRRPARRAPAGRCSHAARVAGDAPGLPAGVGDRRAGRAPGGAGFLHAGRHRCHLRGDVASPLQLRPHGRSPHRAEAAVGEARRRRSGAASLEHPRQRVRRRCRRLHGRHAGHPRPRRPEPGRLRVPRHDRPRRALEDGAAQAGRSPPLRPHHRRRGRAAGRPPARRLDGDGPRVAGAPRPHRARGSPRSSTG